MSTRPSVHRTVALVAVALLGVAACDRRTAAGPDDPINDFPISSLGELRGTVMRASGAAAASLRLTAQIHGVVVITSTTDGDGAFAMRIDNIIGQVLPTDTLVTVFVNARTQVGSVADSLVLRESVQVHLSRNLAAPVVTTVQLRAGY